MKRPHLLLLLVLVAGIVTVTAAQVSALWTNPAPSPAPSPLKEETLQQRFVEDLPTLESDLQKRVSARLKADPDDLEAALLQGLLYFRAGDFDRALTKLDRITRKAPRFHLAHLIRGDLALVHINHISDIGRSRLLSDMPGADEERLEQLRTEAEARLRGYLTIIDGRRIPGSIIQLAPGISHVLLVDKAQHRLYVFENVGPGLPPALVADFYTVIGRIPGNKLVRGDQKTPEGIYYITERIPGSRLPRRYGPAAFPMNYPNELDRRFRKTGDGIWLHGTDTDFYSRPPLDSDGCVVLANDDLKRIERFIKPGVTPIVVADALEWITHEQWHDRRESVLRDIEQWRRDWEQGPVEAYLSHYANDFVGDGLELAAWSERKRQVARGKEYQKIVLSDLTLLAYPKAAADGRRKVVAEFRQDYRSNNFNSVMDKRLYLVQDEQAWRIWHEGRQ